MLRKNNVFIVFFFLLMFLSGCVTLNVNKPKSISEMTPKERGAWFLGIYNSQDRDYRNMVARPDLTNEQKDVLRKKKKIMKEVYPMIKIYNAYIDSGAVPTKEIEDEIVQLINDLTGLVVPMLE